MRPRGDHRGLRERDQRLDGADADVLVARGETGADRRDGLLALEIAQGVERGDPQLGLRRAEGGAQRGPARAAVAAHHRLRRGDAHLGRAAAEREIEQHVRLVLGDLGEPRDDLELDLRGGLRSRAAAPRRHRAASRRRRARRASSASGPSACTATRRSALAAHSRPTAFSSLGTGLCWSASAVSGPAPSSSVRGAGASHRGATP